MRAAKAEIQGPESGGSGWLHANRENLHPAGSAAGEDETWN
jgi:hypothetical protein